MEVILKRSKITKSIANQILNIDLEKTINYEVLGWFVTNEKIKYIVLYNAETNDLKKTPIFATLHYKETGVQVDEIGTHETRYIIEVRYQKLQSISFGYKNKAARDSVATDIDQLQITALEKGQIFL